MSSYQKSILPFPPAQKKKKKDIQVNQHSSDVWSALLGVLIGDKGDKSKSVQGTEKSF